MFLVKDNPDGWGHDTRTWLVEGEQAENSRNLKGGDVGKSGFLPNIAKMLYGLLIISPDYPAALPQTEEGMNKVREVFNTAPFALIEGKKKAGGDNVLKREMEKALEQDKDFLKEEIDILRPNIIVCCDAEDTQIKNGSGYDHCYVLNKKEEGELSLAAKVCEPISGRTMEVYTTEPGVQLYTGNFLSGFKGSHGATYPRRSAICLECQHFPDTPNHPYFPSVTLKPGEQYKQTTIYHFGVDK